MMIVTSVSVNAQLEDAMINQLKKVVKVDNELSIIRVLDWYTGNVADKQLRDAYIQRVYPTIKLNAFSYYLVQEQPVLNVYKAKR